jgi:hypothetical protein
MELYGAASRFYLGRELPDTIDIEWLSPDIVAISAFAIEPLRTFPSFVSIKSSSVPVLRILPSFVCPFTFSDSAVTPEQP